MRYFFLFLLVFVSFSRLAAQSDADSACSGEFLSTHGSFLSLKESEMVRRIVKQAPIQAPLMDRIWAHGIETLCVCFNRKGKVLDIQVLSGPVMMRQAVLDSLKGWTFQPVQRAEGASGGCGALRVHIDVEDGVARSSVEMQKK